MQETIRQRWQAFQDTKAGKRLLKGLQLVFVAGVLGFLIYQLADIGWGEVMRSLPTQPLFYLILVAMYLVLPCAEAVIYGKMWGLRLGESLPVLFRKRALNMDVLGYSGEAYLFMWARERLAMPMRRILATIKDNLILSSMASVLAGVLLLIGLWTTGQLTALNRVMENPSAVYLGGGAFVVVLAVTLALRFRRVLFSQPREVLRTVGGIHLSRFFVSYVLQVTQWAVVLPFVSFENWAILLATMVVIRRIPLIPSADLVFVGVLAQLSPMLDIPVAPVVGMNLVRSVIDRLLNAALFGGALWWERRNGLEKQGMAAVTDASESQPTTASEMPQALPLNT